MSTEQKGHYGAKKLNKLHDKIGGTTEGGACLTGHHASYSKKKPEHTCNYRYQAYRHSDENGAIKHKLHGYSTRRTAPIPTSAPTGKSGRFPAQYCADLAPPGPGDWDIGGPTTAPIKRKSFRRGAVTVPKGMNFTQDTWPYWNNAHHIIPKGTLKERITQESNLVSDLIQQCLLEAKYNINQKINMVLLPQDREVANVLKIPRHLQLDHTDGGVAKAIGNHQVYNDMVLDAKRGLNSIVKDYAKICQDAIDKASRARKPEHKTPKAQLSKKKLENLSKRLLKWILPSKPGFSLDANAKAAGL